MSERHVHRIQGIGMDFPDECRVCHDREAEVERLRAENEQANAEMYRQIDDNARLREKVERLQDSVSMQAHALKKASDEIERLTQVNADKHRVLCETLYEVKRLRALWQTANEGLLESEAEVERLQETSKGKWAGKVAELETAKADLREEVERLQGRVKYLEGRVPGDGWVRVEEVERLRATGIENGLMTVGQVHDLKAEVKRLQREYDEQVDRSGKALNAKQDEVERLRGSKPSIKDCIDPWVCCVHSPDDFDKEDG